MGLGMATDKGEMTVYGVEEAGKSRLIGLSHVDNSIIWNSGILN